MSVKHYINGEWKIVPGTTAPGISPIIEVEDGYWKINGEFLFDRLGNKVKALGVDGKDGIDGIDGKDGANGVDGKNGSDGKDGKDAITPQFKIENDYWYISYDNGNTWNQLGKAKGEDGKDGENGSIPDVESIIDSKIANLKFEDSPADNQYISSVSEEHGVISVARTNLPDYSKVYEPIGTKDWVIEQKYLQEHQDISNLVEKEALTAIQTQLNEKVNISVLDGYYNKETVDSTVQVLEEADSSMKASIDNLNLQPVECQLNDGRIKVSAGKTNTLTGSGYTDNIIVDLESFAENNACALLVTPGNIGTLVFPIGVYTMQDVNNIRGAETAKIVWCILRIGESRYVVNAGIYNEISYA